MDYEPYDSSGTDDDLPPTHQSRMPRGGRVAGNGRPIAGVPYPRMYSEAEMEAQIHHLEQEAYSSVLRAFKAQADAITWEKESLITELRKELRLSNEEHRELLSRVNSDDTIRRIREWRQASVPPSNIVGMGQGVHDPSPSPTVSASRKKQKVGSSLPSFHPQPLSAAHHPSSSNTKHGPPSKGKKQKHAGLPMKSAPYPSGRGKVGGRMSANMAIEGATLVGKRVRTRWPDDNNFYEAVITDYNPVEGRHALVYDIGTTNETWEWVSLSEISPEDIQWVEDTGVLHRGGYGNPSQGINRSGGRGSAYGRGRGGGKTQSRKELLPAENGVGKKTVDEIHILHTDSLIKEVERVFGSNNPDPLEVEKAKKVLKDQEQALIDAIARLADISDGESDGGHHYGQAMERG